MKRDRSRGFTLIELLIVVVVIATLMGLVFRLAGVGGEQSARNRTIARLQKLEFALSGYYAAFGSYPPVPLHGSRDIFCEVNSHGVQIPNSSTRNTTLDWPRVRAACLSQPVACEFPYNSESKELVDAHEMRQRNFKRRAQKASAESYRNNPIYTAGYNLLPNANQVSQNAKSADWTEVQLFKFGVMSFLLPRYLFMLGGPEELYDSPSYNAQWTAQNDLSQLFRFRDGKRLYSKWEDLQKHTSQRKDRTQASDYDKPEYRQILTQPSQSVCARWMQALDGIVSGGRTFYGVNTSLNHDDSLNYSDHEGEYGLGGEPYQMMAIYAPGDAQADSHGNQYALDGMTVRDAWGLDFFYYSPPPYQSYQLWSAGPNQKTMPPWVDLSTLDKKNRDTAAQWISDDIVGLSTPAD